jgi:hypothetical protein
MKVLIRLGLDRLDTLIAEEWELLKTSKTESIEEMCFKVTGKKLIIKGTNLLQDLQHIYLPFPGQFLGHSLHEIGHWLSASEDERLDPNLKLDEDCHRLGIPLQMQREREAFHFEELACLYIQGYDYSCLEHDYAPFEYTDYLFYKFNQEHIEIVGDSILKYFHENPGLEKIILHHGTWSDRDPTLNTGHIYNYPVIGLKN